MITHYGLDEHHRMHREEVAAFCNHSIKPQVDEYEDSGTFPADIIDTLGDEGFYGITVPEQFGGEGMDYRSFAITVEELARVWKIPAGVVSLSCSVIGTILENHGNSWQREEWLRTIFEENQITALSLTEPGAGSDPSGMETTAVLEGNEWVIDGHKVWTSHGAIANFLIVAARVPETDDGDGGITLFGLPNPTGLNGLRVIRDIPCMEGDSVVESEISYDGLRIPEDFRIGEVGDGFKYLMEALGATRHSGTGRRCRSRGDGREYHLR